MYYTILAHSLYIIMVGIQLAEHFTYLNPFGPNIFGYVTSYCNLFLISFAEDVLVLLSFNPLVSFATTAAFISPYIRLFWSVRNQAKSQHTVPDQLYLDEW